MIQRTKNPPDNIEITGKSSLIFYTLFRKFCTKSSPNTGLFYSVRLPNSNNVL